MKNHYPTSLRVFLVLFSIFSFTLSAQTVNVTSSTFPGPPATSCTNTLLDVITIVGCINAVHQGNTVNVTGTNITVDIDYTLGPICLGALSMVQHNINLGMLPPGTYSITINGKLNAAFNSSINTSLVVTSCCTAVPSFNASADTICVGDSVYFGNTSMGSTSGQWFVNNSSVATSTNYGQRYKSPGNYAVKLVVSNGVCSDSLIKNVLVSAPPTLNLGPDVDICPDGGSVTLDAGAGRDSVRWSDNSTGRTLAVNLPGTYYVEVYKNTCSTSDTVVVGTHTVIPVSLGPDAELCYGDTLVLNVQQSGATYLWQDASTQDNFTVTAAGTYHVTRTDQNGCVSRDTISITYDTCFAGISELAAVNNISIFPNPAKDVLFLSNTASQDVSYRISIYNVQGKLVRTISANMQAGDDFGISLKELPAGAYIINIADGKSVSSQHFIKQ